jgi:hypothetical protein
MDSFIIVWAIQIEETGMKKKNKKRLTPAEKKRIIDAMKKRWEALTKKSGIAKQGSAGKVTKRLAQKKKIVADAPLRWAQLRAGSQNLTRAEKNKIVTAAKKRWAQFRLRRKLRLQF